MWRAASPERFWDRLTPSGRHKPKLMVSAYHRSEDLFALPLQIQRIQPGYRFYLRRFPYIPAWEINLIGLWEG